MITTTTSSLAALALAHGFAPDRATASTQLHQVIYVDFGRLSLGLTVKPKTKPNSLLQLGVEIRRNRHGHDYRTDK